jgi:hypothetical protein
MSARTHRLLGVCLLLAGQAALAAHAQPAPAPAAETPAPVTPQAPTSVTTPVAPSASTPATPIAPAAAPELRPMPRSEAEPGSQAAAAPAPASDAEAASGGAQRDAPRERGFVVDVHLGFGVGSTRYERPLPDGSAQRLPESAFAAIDTGLRLLLPDSGRMSLSAALRYRSSLGFQVEESPPFALDSTQDVRVQHIELSARSLWRIGESGWTPALGVELGVAIASFVPELHDRLTPKYALAGPLLRALGRLQPLDWLQLQLGPELGWIALVDGSLGEDGTGAGDQGLSLGAEASARASLFEGLSLELGARSAMVFVASDGERADFENAARFVTLGLVGEL